ncbi:MAG TPA: tetratricopeptide repeat protein [Micropepsaceae bacterium]|nr:tetratricopeptide repeat protein [Micropepsaceae bacterium]
MSEALLANAVRSHQAGNLNEAARLYSAVLQTSPRNFHALYLLGFVHFQQGRFEDAVRGIGEAVKINPGAPDAFYNLGCALQNLQRREQAVATFDRAIALKPDYGEAWINRGVALLALKRHADAVASFDRALALTPRDGEALTNRATALFESKRYEEAAAGFAALIAVAPDFPYVWGNLVLARAYACDWRTLAEDRARLTSDIAAGKSAISPHASTLIIDDAAAQLSVARHWVADRCPPSPGPHWRGEIYGHDKIRIAYLSADFHAHATAFLIAGVFEHHDRARFEVTLVSFGRDDNSEMRTRLKRGGDRFIEAGDKADGDIALLLRQMEIDIAADLKGFTQDSRPGVFALRPAPVQVNYLGHPGTMGADYMDYILADDIVIPPDHRRYYSESVVSLPDSYQSNDSKRRMSARVPSRSEAGLPQDGFVFACFNNSFKITPTMFDIWMRLLRDVPGSVLWLLEDSAVAVANLRREAEARGIAASRLVFAPRMSLEDHLARQRLGDLFLDTLPCCAHTTASDALFAGLPVLTVLGSTFAGRVAASLLHAVGLPELIAPSLADYETLARTLAREPARLAALKNKLAKNRDSTPLFDTARFTRHLDAAYAEMCERYRRGEKPAAFAVSRQA